MASEYRSAPVNLEALTAPAPLARDTARAEARFVTINLVACIFLQRFGVIAGGSELYLCFLVFFVSSIWMLLQGNAAVRVPILFLFLACGASFIISALLGLAFPRPDVTLSVTSLVALVVYYLIFVVGPVPNEARADVFKIFVVIARICCVAGIVQYALQFVGVYLFTLGSVIPVIKPILVEANYNTEGFLTWGSQLRRANGIFLLEPGGFSQIIAIAVLIDVFIRKIFRFLPLYLLAYIVSYSGTGVLSLLICLALSTVFAPKQGKYVIPYLLAAVPLMTALYFIFPTPIETLLGRAAEFQQPGTSGYLRYVAQAKAWAFFSSDWRAVMGSGPGAFERSPTYVIGSTSVAIKLFAEYGAVGLALFTTFLVTAVWNRKVPIISVMMLVIYQFGGGNLLQPPTLILMALLCVWSMDRSERQAQNA